MKIIGSYGTTGVIGLLLGILAVLLIDPFTPEGKAFLILMVILLSIFISAVIRLCLSWREKKQNKEQGPQEAKKSTIWLPSNKR